MKRVASFLLGLFAVALLASLLAWVVPVVLVVVILALQKRHHFYRALWLGGVAAAANSLWVDVLLTYGGRLPAPIQAFLVMGVASEADVPPHASSFALPVTGPEWLGYLALLSVAGAVTLLFLIPLELTRHLGGSERRRRTAYQLTTLLVAASAVYALFASHVRYALLLAYIVGAIAVSTVFSWSDPAHVVNQLNDK